MALNPDIAAYLELVGNGRSSGKSLPMHQLTVQQAREQFDQSSALMDPGLDEPLPRVETLFVPARDGTPLPARLYSPTGRALIHISEPTQRRGKGYSGF
ncbi:hypothetical protein ACLI34_31355, partial [Pseudomonas aeruginosa]